MWKKIAEYEDYKIHRDGRVKRLVSKYSRKERILKHSIASNGYVQISLCKDGKAKVFRLHRLLAETFISNPENKPQVNHKDGNKKNYSLSNLEWMTASENNLHSIRVLKRKPPRSMLGKLGKDHNLSKHFYIQYLNGDIIKYESGLEFKRITGFDHTSISWARKKKKSGYKFLKKGNLKNLIVHFEILEV